MRSAGPPDQKGNFLLCFGLSSVRNPAFQNSDELSRVPGLDPVKVEATIELLEFWWAAALGSVLDRTHGFR